jgi:hypothetical protein
MADDGKSDGPSSGKPRRDGQQGTEGQGTPRQEQPPQRPPVVRPEQARGRQVRRGTAEGIVALQADIYITGSMALYARRIDEIARRTFGTEIDTKKPRSQIKRLKQVGAFNALFLMWLTSDYLSDEQRKLANLKPVKVRDRRRPSNDAPDKRLVMTRNRLAKVMMLYDGYEAPVEPKRLAHGATAEQLAAYAIQCERHVRALDEYRRMENMYAQRANRYVEAAIAFRLVEPDGESATPKRDNCKPLRVTELLNELMLDIGVSHADAIASDSRGTRKRDKDGNDDPSAE